MSAPLSDPSAPRQPSESAPAPAPGPGSPSPSPSSTDNGEVGGGSRPVSMVHSESSERSEQSERSVSTAASLGSSAGSTVSSEARERLAALGHLDTKIVEILNKGSKVIQALIRGKKQDVVPAATAQEEFGDALEEYNDLIITVNKDLHEEVKRLHAAFKTSVMPLHVPVRANTLGSEKESELWQTIYKSLGGEMDDTDGQALQAEREADGRDPVLQKSQTPDAMDVS